MVATMLHTDRHMLQCTVRRMTSPYLDATHITYAEAAVKYDVSIRTLQRLVSQGLLNRYRRPGLQRLLLSDAELSEIMLGANEVARG